MIRKRHELHFATRKDLPKLCDPDGKDAKELGMAILKPKQRIEPLSSSCSLLPAANNKPKYSGPL